MLESLMPASSPYAHHPTRVYFSGFFRRATRKLLMRYALSLPSATIPGDRIVELPRHWEDISLA